MGQPQGQCQNSALLSQQAQNLLEEARNENRILEDNVATLKEQVTINFGTINIFSSGNDIKVTI